MKLFQTAAKITVLCSLFGFVATVRPHMPKQLYRLMFYPQKYKTLDYERIDDLLELISQINPRIYDNLIAIPNRYDLYFVVNERVNSSLNQFFDVSEGVGSALIQVGPKALMPLSKYQERNALSRALNSYDDLTIPDMSDQERDHYLRLIKEINPEFHTYIKAKEQQGKPLIQRDIYRPKSGSVLLVPFQDEPFFCIGKQVQNWNRTAQEDFLERLIDEYFMDKAERTYYLKLIHQLDQQLYELFKQAEDAGNPHIIRGYIGGTNSAVVDLLNDDTPTLAIGVLFRRLPLEEQRFYLLHEIAHWQKKHGKKAVIFESFMKDAYKLLYASVKREFDAQGKDYGENEKNVTLAVFNIVTTRFPELIALQKAFDRQMEFQADEIAVRTRGFIEGALLGFSPDNPRLDKDMVDRHLMPPDPFENATALWDTHPSDQERLERIKSFGLPETDPSAPAQKEEKSGRTGKKEKRQRLF